MKLVLIIFLFTWAFSQKSAKADFVAYSTAYSSIAHSDWPRAIKQFKAFNARFPLSSYAGNSTFWLSYSYAKSKDYYTAFHEYKNAFTNHQLPEDLIERCKKERLKIAFELRTKNAMFDEFIRHGADYTDEFVIALNKKTFYKTKLKKLNDSYKRRRAYIVTNQATLSKDEKFKLDQELSKNSEQISYYDNISAKVDEKIAKFKVLLKVPKIGEEAILNDMIQYYEKLNGNYYKLVSQINSEQWEAALITSEKLLDSDNNAKYFNKSLYWNSFITQQIAIKNNDVKTLNVLFLQFSDLIDQMKTKHLKFECKVNRIMIAKLLADQDKKYRYFLESGADFKFEIKRVYQYLTYIQNPKYFKKVSQLFQFDELQIAIQNAKVTKKALDATYDSKFVDYINKFAENLLPYYGAYQIDLDKFAR